jgi:crotonobetainyl-CoA:carnitine CoA-transferase CaiB-like acyl-CoA transferase
VMTREQALEALNAAGIPAAPILSLSDVVRDEQVLARNAIVRRTSATGEGYVDVAPPWKLASVDRNDQFLAPPAKGAHTREVLRGIGLTTESIEELITEGAAWAP